MRLFVAVWPDEATRELLSELQGALSGLGGKGLSFVGPTRWHVTLQFLGEVSGELVEPLGAGLARAGASAGGALRCGLGPATAWFPGGKVLQLPASGLEGFADAVHQECGAVLGSASGERFSGHLTIGRARGRAGPPGVAGIPCASTFDVTSVDLVQSEGTPEGHRYSTLARVELGGG
ncbi:MAG TPA: RNA 2',3'-cyclic phosphodiesterase [Acidimicrobiales bacterium]